jgi:hypothetical protein
MENRMLIMSNSFRPDEGTILEDAALDWLRLRFPTAKHYARAVGINPETAKKRLTGDPIDRRGLRVSELGRAIAGDWRGFVNEVVRPVFETPADQLQREIDETEERLARLVAARAAAVAALTTVEPEP